MPPEARAVSASQVKQCCRCCTPPSSNCGHRIRLPAVSSSFSAARFQSRSLTRPQSSSNYRLPSLMAGNGLQQLTSGASSGDAITGLSYPGTRRACAQRCRTFQVSPHAPAAFLQPHQPTCLECVVPSRARLLGIFTTFNIVRVGRITAVPVSLSPNPISSSLRY